MAPASVLMAGLIAALLLGNVLVITSHREPEPLAGGSPERRFVDVELAPVGTAAVTRCDPAPLARRAAAVLVVGLPDVTQADADLARELTDMGVGGVLITKSNVEDTDQISALIDGLRERSEGPLVVTTDEEPGRVSSFGAVRGRSSSARTLARRQTPAQVGAFAEEMASDLARLGVDVALAPVADLDAGPAGGVIGDRAFSDDPDTAARYVRAYLRGLERGGLGAAVKHFPGHGRSAVDSHRKLSVVDASLAELRRDDLVPFQASIAAGVPVVMLGHVAYTGIDEDLPASLSPAAYELLRSMGFDGVALTDSIGMGAINLTWDFPVAAVMALGAGADAVLATDGGHAARMRDAIVAAVESGALSEARLDEAVARVLRWAGAEPSLLVC